MKKWAVILAASGMVLCSSALAKVSLDKININVATAKELTTVKGIGPKRAAAIVAFRQQHGRFKSINELTAIRGISQKSLARLAKENPGKLVLK